MASRYNLLDYDSDQDAHEVPDVNLLSVAFFIADLFQRHGITYDVMGGFALRLMGSPRDTHDVDIAFQAPGKMRDLWGVVEGERRYAILYTYIYLLYRICVHICIDICISICCTICNCDMLRIIIACFIHSDVRI